MDEAPEQLDLFEENGELALLQRQLAAMRRQHSQWQRLMNTRYRQLSKLCLHMQEENSQLQRRLCFLEKNLPSCPNSNENGNDDYLIKLFAAAYVSSA